MPTNRQFLALGLVIRRHREDMKQTQEAFATDQGMGQSYYGAIERGNHNLTLWNFFRIAEGLGVTAAQLLREAEQLDVAKALKLPPRPPRRGRPPGSGRRSKAVKNK
jgi:transcriptional regulator with XRE-family HTH domain